ncbi:MAG: hypothetical protein EZS28_013590 [Streblomastix strix]|uniref:Uncharacterized protein n=1 Tax=Streblomastix strix TaxID=222440 RepID=A0A5J4W7Q7_9EUKA|nr:MAG: hypothetical protein EZS28_013590 [Streblomastix strix]
MLNAYSAQLRGDTQVIPVRGPYIFRFQGIPMLTPEMYAQEEIPTKQIRTGLSEKVYSLPSTDEIAAVCELTDEEEFYEASYLSFPKHGGLKYLSVIDPTKDGMVFPVLLHKGLRKIPSIEQDSELHNAVLKHMVHRECHEGSECQENNECKKGFPKLFCEFTQLADNGYPLYQRKDSPIEATEEKYENNRSKYQVIANSNEDRSLKKVSVVEVQNYINGLCMCAHEAYMKIMGVTYFTFDNVTKLWKPKLGGMKTIGRLCNVSSKELELFSTTCRLLEGDKFLRSTLLEA